MYIVPLNNTIAPLSTPSQTEKTVAAAEENGASFIDVFKDAFKTAEETQKVSEEDSIKVMLGEIDDPSEIAINSQKAALALQTFVSLKNAAVDAYKEIMQMQM